MIRTFLQWRFRRRFIAALAELPELSRAVFLDSARHGLNYDEIAERRGLRRQDVETLLRSALTDLHEVLYPDEEG